jgi:3-methyladenine DNA glycosylase AlkD
MQELKAKENPSAKKMLMKHGVLEPFFGVKVGDMKIIQKRVKKNYQLSKDLYATGNSDAMYLAGLIADEQKMTKRDLTDWVVQAKSPNIYNYTVPWITAESKYGFELGIQWIDSKKTNVAAAGWATLSSVVAITPDSELDLGLLKKLLARVEKEIHLAYNQVHSNMNIFVISVGSHVLPLSETAIETARRIGSVEVDVGETACKVPNALDYIQKAKYKGNLGKEKNGTLLSFKDKMSFYVSL